MRYLFIVLTLLLLASCSHQSGSHLAPQDMDTVSAPTYIAGRDYQLLEQQLIDAPDVIEIFFYGCEACYRLAPELSWWSAAKDLDVVLIPAHNQRQLVNAARLFHTLESMGLDNLHLNAYALYHEESQLDGEDRINEMLKANDVKPELFWSVWSSDVINQRLSGSYAVNAMLGVGVTPTFIVQGKYKVEVNEVGESDTLFGLLEYLVKLEE